MAQLRQFKVLLNKWLHEKPRSGIFVIEEIDKMAHK